jgi:hypothetical protein
MAEIATSAPAMNGRDSPSPRGERGPGGEDSPHLPNRIATPHPADIPLSAQARETPKTDTKPPKTDTPDTQVVREMSVFTPTFHPTPITNAEFKQICP